MFQIPKIASSIRHDRSSDFFRLVLIIMHCKAKKCTKAPQSALKRVAGADLQTLLIALHDCLWYSWSLLQQPSAILSRISWSWSLPACHKHFNVGCIRAKRWVYSSKILRTRVCVFRRAREGAMQLQTQRETMQQYPHLIKLPPLPTRHGSALKITRHWRRSPLHSRYFELPPLA